MFTFGAKVRESLTDTTRKENTDVKNKLNAIPNKSEILDEARKNATQIIHDATHGHVVTTANEQLIMDTDDVKTAKNLWRWNLGGLAHSSNGYDGAYDTAITMDGQIIGERIVANSIDASKLSINYKQSVEKKITVSLDDSKKYADEKQQVQKNTRTVKSQKQKITPIHKLVMQNQAPTKRQMKN